VVSVPVAVDSESPLESGPGTLTRKADKVRPLTGVRNPAELISKTPW
jgi:hypothetical protein